MHKRSSGFARFASQALAAAIAIALQPPATAATFAGGIEFADIAFADRITRYQPGSGVGWEYRRAEQALNAPDYTRRCRGCDYVSLGNGGSLILEFTDNILTGSGDRRPDLWIFEIGTVFEAVSVFASSNGLDWFALGKTTGYRSGIDLDAFGFGRETGFSLVKLVDDPLGRGYSYPSAGADIDAVGAASTRRVPEPGNLLALGGLGSLVWIFGDRARSSIGSVVRETGFL